MNGSSEADLGPGVLNPVSNGIGKNAAIVKLDAFDAGGEGFLESKMFQIRSKGGSSGWGENSADSEPPSNCGNHFEQWYLQPYLKLLSRASSNDGGNSLATRDNWGRLRVVGYLDGVIETDFYAGSKAETLGDGNGISIVDGAIFMLEARKLLELVTGCLL